VNEELNLKKRLLVASIADLVLIKAEYEKQKAVIEEYIKQLTEEIEELTKDGTPPYIA